MFDMHLLRTLPRFQQNRFLSMPHTLASSTKFLQKLERGILHAECLSPCMRNWKPSTRTEKRHCIGHAALRKVLFGVSRSRTACCNDHIKDGTRRAKVTGCVKSTQRLQHVATSKTAPTRAGRRHTTTKAWGDAGVYS